MKIDVKADSQAQSSGVDAQVMGFDVRKTAKLFHMLSNTLYSDKLGSINRELASNCHDSHYLAGNLDRPFVVRCPTYENPFYEIRDYGVGLTEEEANASILCYLGSDKDDREDLIGGWGIGAKSPFAYTTTYEVIVYKNGTMTHFTCWKDDSGLPQKAVINQCETDEETGVLIRMPVETKDVLQCESKLREYINWTNYNTEVHIGDNVLKSRAPLAEKDFGSFRVKVYASGSGSKRLVYGGFSYNMTSCVDNRYDYASQWKILETKLRYGYDVAFVINSPNVVSFAMNREVLEQTEKSRNFVTNMVNEFGEYANAKHKIVNKMSEEFFKRANHSKTLAATDEFIEELNREIKDKATEFDTVFVSSLTKITFNFSSVSKITLRGVHWLTRVEFEPKPIHEQICVFYGRLTKPSPSAREEALFSLEKDNSLNLYVKAKTEDEARTIVGAYPEFADYDVSKLDFYEVVIPKKTAVSSRSSRAPRTKPVPYCRELKKRYSWKPITTYVICEKLVDTNELISKSLSIEYLHRFSNVVYLVPTDLFVNETEQCDNVISFDDLEEFALAYMHDDLDPKKKTALTKKVSDTRYHISNVLYQNLDNMPESVGKELQEIESTLADFEMVYGCPSKASMSEALHSYMMKKLYDPSVLNQLKNRLTRVIIRMNKLKPYSKYVNLNSITDGSDIGNAVKSLLEAKGIHV